MSRPDLTTLAAIARHRRVRCGAHVLVDEVYLDAAAAVRGDHDRIASAARLDGPVIVTSSLTKSYGLAGLRSGWAIAPAATAERMRRTRDVDRQRRSAPGRSARGARVSTASAALAARARRSSAKNSRSRAGSSPRILSSSSRSRHAARSMFPATCGCADAEPFVRAAPATHGVAVAPGHFFELARPLPDQLSAGRTDRLEAEDLRVGSVTRASAAARLTPPCRSTPQRSGTSASRCWQASPSASSGKWSGHADGPRARFAGLRTFTLLGLVSGLSGWLWVDRPRQARRSSCSPASARWSSSPISPPAGTDVDGTTEVAAFVVLAAGLLAGAGLRRGSSAAIIALTVLLLVEKTPAARPRLASSIVVELRAGARFAVMAAGAPAAPAGGPVWPARRDPAAPALGARAVLLGSQFRRLPRAGGRSAARAGMRWPGRSAASCLRRR